MRTNCELPMAMVGDNIRLNDYDFVLYHLYISNPQYRTYYKNLRLTDPSRMMILDNSAYEFYIQGKQLDLDAYVKCIQELKPDYFILPDVLQDMEKTLEDTNAFLRNYMIDGDSINESKAMAVCQGSTDDELMKCFRQYVNDNRISYIGIPFHIEFYKNLTIDSRIILGFRQKYNNLTEDILYAMGRTQWITDHERELDSCNKKIHLLGSHCPYEKYFWRNKYWTMDTGYPVKCGMMGDGLGYEEKKPSLIIDDFIDNHIEDTTRSLIRMNVEAFRTY